MNRINLSVCRTGTLSTIFVLHGRLIAAWLLGISIIFGTLSAHAQRNLTLFHMRGIPQTGLLNPAFLHNSKWFLGVAGLSSVNASWSNTGFTFSDLGIQKPIRFAGPDAMYTMASTYADANNYTNGDGSLQLLFAGYRHGDNFFNFSIDEHLETDQNYPLGLVSLIGDYRDVQIPFGHIYDLADFTFTGTHYRSIGLGYARRFGENLSFGGRVKFLVGLEHIQGANTGLAFSIEDYSEGPPIYMVENSLNLMSSGMTHFSGDDPAGVFGDGNFGFAIDLGGVLKISDNVEVSASITNLGMIRWKNNLSYRMINSFDPDTSTISTFLDHFFDSNIDTLIHHPSGEGVPAYTSSPASQLFIGTRYKFNNQHSLGLLLNTRFQEQRTDIGGSLAYVASPADWVDLSASYTVYNDNYFNIGFGAAFNFGPVQMYISTDNVAGMVSPSSTNNAHVNVGINLIFGRDSDQEATKKNKIEDIAVDLASDSLAITDPAEFAEEEVEGEDVPAYVKNTFIIKGQVNEAVTNNPVYATYIDVYKISLDGVRELVYTSRFANGKFEIHLPKSEERHELKIETFGYDDLTFPFYANGSDIEKIFQVAELEPVAPEPAPVEPATDEEEPEATEEVVEETPAEGSKAAVYLVTAATSLRTEATHQSAVELRFKGGDEVKVLEETNEWWWKVEFKGKIGYVKKSLLISAE